MNKHLIVSCFFCHTPNRIRIGYSFFDADTLYTCYKCGKGAHVKLRQKAQTVSESTAPCQVGEPINESLSTT